MEIIHANSSLPAYLVGISTYRLKYRESIVLVLRTHQNLLALPQVHPHISSHCRMPSEVLPSCTSSFDFISVKIPFCKAGFCHGSGRYTWAHDLGLAWQSWLLTPLLPIVSCGRPQRSLRGAKPRVGKRNTHITYPIALALKC